MMPARWETSSTVPFRDCSMAQKSCTQSFAWSIGLAISSILALLIRAWDVTVTFSSMAFPLIWMFCTRIQLARTCSEFISEVTGAWIQHPTLGQRRIRLGQRRIRSGQRRIRMRQCWGKCGLSEVWMASISHKSHSFSSLIAWCFTAALRLNEGFGPQPVPQQKVLRVLLNLSNSNRISIFMFFLFFLIFNVFSIFSFFL